MIEVPRRICLLDNRIDDIEFFSAYPEYIHCSYNDISEFETIIREKKLKSNKYSLNPCSIQDKNVKELTGKVQKSKISDSDITMNVMSIVAQCSLLRSLNWTIQKQKRGKEKRFSYFLNKRLRYFVIKVKIINTLLHECELIIQGKDNVLFIKFITQNDRQHFFLVKIKNTILSELRKNMSYDEVYLNVE